jgi:hypothetical protein
VSRDLEIERNSGQKKLAACRRIKVRCRRDPEQASVHHLDRRKTGEAEIVLAEAKPYRVDTQ